MATKLTDFVDWAAGFASSNYNTTVRISSEHGAYDHRFSYNGYSSEQLEKIQTNLKLKIQDVSKGVYNTVYPTETPTSKLYAKSVEEIPPGVDDVTISFSPFDITPKVVITGTNVQTTVKKIAKVIPKRHVQIEGYSQALLLKTATPKQAKFIRAATKYLSEY